jgi:uncharacterized protein
MHACFGLVLMITHACNLRCSYCYVGRKRHASMRQDIARVAIDRAVRSTEPGGAFELGFFGGEPLLEAAMILDAIDYAQRRAAESSLRLRVTLTTNGTVTTNDAWAVMMRPEIELSISHDGLPEVHDRYRRDVNGHGTSSCVLSTIQRLMETGRDPNIVMVVRPDTAIHLPAGIEFFHDRGLRRVEPSLDLWATWQREDAAVLCRAIGHAADVWAAHLPGFEVGWFVEKAVHLAGLPMPVTARCGFGENEVAVAPSGNLYPCERLIGEDDANHPMRLPGHALDGTNFSFPPPPSRSSRDCDGCAIKTDCKTDCRCGNYVRTGDVNRPDGLLCLLDQTCYRETARVLGQLHEATNPLSILSI